MKEFFNRRENLYYIVKTQEYRKELIKTKWVVKTRRKHRIFSSLFSLYSRVLPRFLYTFFISKAFDVILLFRILQHGSWFEFEPSFIRT